jgi:5'-3' exonuclease/transcription antitermination factor NusG
MASDPNTQWIVVELTPHGEKETPAAIHRAALKILGRCEVYVPALETQIGEDKTIHYLMPGYAFLRKERADRDYRRLEGTRLFQTPLKTSKGLATVTSSYIEELKEKLRAEVNQGIGVGDVVLICSGPYKNIEATVITEIPEERTVQVHIQLRSKQSIITLPRSALKVVDRAPLSLYFARLGHLRSWLRMAKIVLSYRGDLEGLNRAFLRYAFVSRSMASGRVLFSFIYAYPEDGGGLRMVHAEVLRQFDLLQRVAEWLELGRTLYNVVHFSSFDALRREVQDRFSKYHAICQIEERLRAMSEEVEYLFRDLARGNKDVGEAAMQNVLIDGHNLAFRCAYAPGMARLTDGKGRPTGMILGFLRSLGALRKRFPEANIWVAWDGSSKRRRARYPDYKAHRLRKETSVNVGGEIFDPIHVLREILPLLGVRQAWNPEEEADDVLATLVRGELEGQTNLICSTDRDFLQLVTASTMFLFPAVGSRKEVLYDAAGVEQQLGLPPERVIHLRALFGDSSDNLPGVARVPKKVLRGLIQEHGSVQGLYASGLAALNKGQYERLMEAAPQVRINLELMALLDVGISRIDPDVDSDRAAERLHSLDIKAPPIVQAILGRPPVSS